MTQVKKPFYKSETIIYAVLTIALGVYLYHLGHVGEAAAAIALGLGIIRGRVKAKDKISL